MKRIAIQGIRGSFHDIAAHLFFRGEELELVCCNSFEELFERMANEKGLIGVAAIENTIAGSLLHNYELLRRSGMVVVGEQKLHIEHSLLCLPEDDMDSLTEVNSHPVAFMQCREYLSLHKNLKVVESYDTAGAAADIASKGLLGHAAICHADAAEIYGLKVLEYAIEDNKHNFTRFLIVSRSEEAKAMLGDTNKASLVFSLPHNAGSLSQVLSIFNFYNINLTKIQSLPIIGHEWEYLFYVDLTYNDFQRYKQSIEAVRPLTKEMRILGEYKESTTA